MSTFDREPLPTAPEARANPARPHCVIVSTGGTIGLRGADALDRNEYMYGGAPVRADEMLSGFAEADGIPSFEVVSYIAKPSHDLTTEDQVGLARVVEKQRSRPDVVGVVVQHGTNSLEETAFLLDLLLPAGKPVVVVGSMRPMGVLGSDAEGNLLDALRVAADAGAAERGVLVCLSGQIFAASDVAKVDSRSLPGFAALRWGPLGLVEPDGSVFLARRPTPGPGLLGALGDRVDLPRVDIVTTYTGADGRMISAAVAAGSRGLVSAGGGAGFPTSAELVALRRASADGVLVCRSSRLASAFAHPPHRTAGDPDPDFVWSGRLNAVQARAVLCVALAISTPGTAAAVARAVLERY